MILLHQEEVDLLKTVILFPFLLQPPSTPPPPLHLERRRGADSLSPEVPLHALQTYIAHCFDGRHVFCGALGPFGVAGLSVCRLVGGKQEWVACEGKGGEAVDAGIPNRW